jgi:endonuclease/exonuclease/phosphatase family metal-dependent hydrolase
VEIRVITWNLFHGRDDPPDPALHTARSRFLRVPERNATHVQVNRDLFGDFATVLRRTEWDIALLQECPPAWSNRLAAETGGDAHRALTSRNWLTSLRRPLARLNPDLMGSWEGGSNVTLVRAGQITQRREATLCRLPERRVLVLTGIRVADRSLCVANLHASTGRERAERDVARAADAAIAFAGETPLIFGGDLNLRPEQTGVFGELARVHGLRAEGEAHWIDHLLTRGLETVGPAHVLPARQREVTEDGLAIRLSDHDLVAARFVLLPGA